MGGKHSKGLGVTAVLIAVGGVIAATGGFAETYNFIENKWHDVRGDESEPIPIVEAYPTFEGRLFGSASLGASAADMPDTRCSDVGRYPDQDKEVDRLAAFLFAHTGEEVSFRITIETPQGGQVLQSFMSTEMVSIGDSEANCSQYNSGTLIQIRDGGTDGPNGPALRLNGKSGVAQISGLYVIDSAEYISTGPEPMAFIRRTL